MACQSLYNTRMENGKIHSEVQRTLFEWQDGIADLGRQGWHLASNGGGLLINECGHMVFPSALTIEVFKDINRQGAASLRRLGVDMGDVKASFVSHLLSQRAGWKRKGKDIGVVTDELLYEIVTKKAGFLGPRGDMVWDILEGLAVLNLGQAEEINNLLDARQVILGAERPDTLYGEKLRGLAAQGSTNRGITLAFTCGVKDASVIDNRIGSEYLSREGKPILNSCQIKKMGGIINLGVEAATELVRSEHLKGGSSAELFRDFFCQ